MITDYKSKPVILTGKIVAFKCTVNCSKHKVNLECLKLFTYFSIIE